VDCGNYEELFTRCKLLNTDIPVSCQPYISKVAQKYRMLKRKKMFLTLSENIRNAENRFTYSTLPSQN